MRFSLRIANYVLFKNILTPLLILFVHILHAQELPDLVSSDTLANRHLSGLRIHEYNQYYNKDSIVHKEDYCTYHYQFNEKGQITEESCIYASGDRFPYSYTTHYVYKGGRLSEVTRRNKNEGNLIWRHKYLNKRSQVIVHEIEAYGTLRYKNYYNKDKIARDTLVRFLRMPSQQKTMSMYRVYDSLGLMSERTCFYRYDSIGNKTTSYENIKQRTKDFYTNDTLNLVYSVIENKIPIEEQIYLYNKPLQLLSKEFLSLTESKKRLQLFIYDNGLLQRIETKIINKSGITEAYIREFEYLRTE